MCVAAVQQKGPIDQPPLTKLIFSRIPGVRVNLIAFYSHIILKVTHPGHCCQL